METFPLTIPSSTRSRVPPSGGSLEIGNLPFGSQLLASAICFVPPSGGSLEIGNTRGGELDRSLSVRKKFPLRGDP